FDQFNQGPFFHYRAEAFWNINDKHNLRAVYAPLELTVKSDISHDVNFNEKNFSATEDLEVKYRFNSYRLTYYYSFWGQKESQFNLGLTGKIRDAKIEFKNSAQQTSCNNVGFVPLIYIEYQTPVTTDWLFNINAD